MSITGTVEHADDARSGFAALLPSSVHVAEGPLAQWANELYEAEKAFVAQAVPKRCREFAAGRDCARFALSLAGCPPVAIPVGEGRMPLFPRGVCGAITHTADYCAAAVAHARTHAAVGIDAEVMRPLEPGVIALATLPEERAALRQLPEIPGILWPLVVFSIKEAFFKCYFPVFRHYIDFTDVRVELNSSGTFEIEPFAAAIDVRMRSRIFRGLFSIENGLVRSAMVIEPSEEWPSI